MSSTCRHIRFDQLIDLVESRLTAKGQKQAQAHVSACTYCTGEVAWLERVIGLMRADNPAEPPPYLVACIIDLFRSRMRSRDGLDLTQSDEARQGDAAF